MHAHLAAKPELGVRCCVGSNAEREKAIRCLGTQRKLVVDILALMTIQRLGVGDDIVGAFGKLGLVRSTLDLIENHLNSPAMRLGEHMTLGRVGDRYVPALVTEEVVAHNRRVLEDSLRWVEANCEVLVCSAALEIERQVRQELATSFGSAAGDTILVAADQSAVLYTDDRVLRQFVEAKHGVVSAWTQTVLLHLRDEHIISEDRYAEHVIQLVCGNYYHTTIDDRVLLKATEAAGWRSVSPFSHVVLGLGGKRSNCESALGVAVKYLYLLWEERLPDQQYEDLILAVINVLVSDRAEKRRILSRFERKIMSRFLLAPVEIHRIRKLRQVWEATHII